MTLKSIAKAVEGKILTGCEDLEIESFYAGDFLSHVMGGAPSGCAWLTIMNNINVAGVAVIADIRAIIICEKIEPIGDLVKKCEVEHIALIASPLNVFQCAAKITQNQ